jgi:adenylate cyclase
LAKARIVIPLNDGLAVELDVFEGDLEGLLIAEIEFPDEDRSHRFEPPDWLGQEVTGDDRFSGRSLALNGAPPV